MDFIEFDEPAEKPAPKSEKGITFEIPGIFARPKLKTKQKEEPYTPFDRVDDRDSKSIFEFLELDTTVRKLPSKKDWVTCTFCGAINPRRNNFCFQCQEELITFRQVELDARPQKVVLTFKQQKKYIFCPTCGGANEPDSKYCKDCMASLEE